jgi:hypothetical protein
VILEGLAVSVFYVLPPRPLMGEHFAGYLHSLFPGLRWGETERLNLADALAAAATCHPNVYVVFREELPNGDTTRQALLDGFGAEAGDEVIEVRPGGSSGELVARRWQIRAAA